MAYARITFMKPIAGREEDAATLNRDLVGLYREQAGCQLSHTLVATDGSGEIGRMSLWESENAADSGHTRPLNVPPLASPSTYRARPPGPGFKAD